MCYNIPELPYVVEEHDRTSRISYKVASVSPVITLPSNLNCCPGLPTKRKEPTALRHLKPNFKPWNGSWRTTHYL